MCKPNMKRKQMPHESKLTSFFSKKSKAQSSSVVTEHGEQSTDQQSAAVALETKVTTHFNFLEPFVTLTDSMPTKESMFSQMSGLPTNAHWSVVQTSGKTWTLYAKFLQDCTFCYSFYMYFEASPHFII